MPDRRRSVAIVELSLVASAAAAHAADASARNATAAAAAHAHAHAHAHTHAHAQAHERLLLLLLLMQAKAGGSVELLTGAADAAAAAAAAHAQGFILAGRPQLVLHVRGGSGRRSGCKRRADADADAAASWRLGSIVVVVIARRTWPIDHATTAAAIHISAARHAAGPAAQQSARIASAARCPSRRALAQGRDMSLQHRMISHRGEHQTLFIIVFAEYFILAQIETIANTESARREREKDRENENKGLSVNPIGIWLICYGR